MLILHNLPTFEFQKLISLPTLCKKNMLAQRLLQQSLWSTTTEIVFIPIKTCSVAYNFNIRVFSCGSLSNCLTIGNPNWMKLETSAVKHRYFYSRRLSWRNNWILIHYTWLHYSTLVNIHTTCFNIKRGHWSFRVTLIIILVALNVLPTLHSNLYGTWIFILVLDFTLFHEILVSKTGIFFSYDYTNSSYKYSVARLACCRYKHPTSVMSF